MTAATACRPSTLAPAALAPASADSARGWALTTAPKHGAGIRFKWRYEDRKLNAAGRATARVAPPDSVRLDYAATLGLSSGAGVVVGDSVIWADPDQDFRSFIRGVRVFWATLGVARPAPAGAVVTAGLVGSADHPRMAWRYATGADTLTYVGGNQVLDVEWRNGSTVVARSHTELDQRGWPARAQVEFPEAGARFELTV
ncbi:MAG TPA: hypothetical protein VH163_07630, partial [Gemmatimonadales bacterium]|nr:hypothetical protein [Gemmatimonadales bacterium]